MLLAASGSLRIVCEPIAINFAWNLIVGINHQTIGRDVLHVEGRTYAGWTHHVVLAAVAFIFLQIERARQPDAPHPTLPVVRGWVREVLGLLYILHNPRLLGMLDSFRRNAPLRR